MILQNEFGNEIMTIGANLKRLRREKGLTQDQLSNLCGIELNHISKIELDKSDPKLTTIYKLINGLECSADALLIDSDKLNIDGKLANCLERAGKLPPRAKAVIVELIDHYCVSYAMKQVMRNNKVTLWPYFKDDNIICGATESLNKEPPDLQELKDD